MKTVQFKDDNRTAIIATGYTDKQSAESAMDSFLANEGEAWGRSAYTMEHEGDSGLEFVARVDEDFEIDGKNER